MKLPGPDHPITIAANPKRVRVLADGVVVADTTHALTLKEASYPAVQYVPRADAKIVFFTLITGWVPLSARFLPSRAAVLVATTSPD